MQNPNFAYVVTTKMNVAPPEKLRMGIVRGKYALVSKCGRIGYDANLPTVMEDLQQKPCIGRALIR